MKQKKVICVLICAAILILLASGCSNKRAEDGIQTIYIGHHYQPEDDPYWVDEITGEHGMNEVNRRAAIVALDRVKDSLGVEIKWVSYPSAIQRCVLQSVLAGDPLCDLAIMANGTQASLLSQNVLQPLDQYKDIFDSNPNYQWLLLDKCFGHYYLLNRDFLFMNNWPFVYNATMIEEVPGLKRDGQTIYPATLYEEGNWTWNTFEDYLSILQAYYTGKQTSAGKAIYPFHTNYAHTLLFALHSNGANVYDGATMSFDTEEAKVAGEYLTKLIDKGLMVTLAAGPRSTNTGYTEPGECFMRGESVFTNAARWRMDNYGEGLAERGESMGVIPFPRPDDIEMTDPYEDYGKSRYQIYSAVADSVGLLRGVDPEKSRMALEAYAMYRSEFYNVLGGTSTLDEYKGVMAVNKAVEDGVDIFHPVIGDANLRIYEQLGSIPENEYAESIELMGVYCNEIFGQSAYGVNGAPAFRVNVEARKGNVHLRLERIAETLKSDMAEDLTAPSSARTDSQLLAFPKGTDPRKIQWLDYFGASDDIDGTYEIQYENGKYAIRGSNDIARAKEKAKKEKLEEDPEVPFEENRFFIDFSAVDFNTVGEYTDSIVIKVIDSSKVLPMSRTFLKV